MPDQDGNKRQRDQVTDVEHQTSEDSETTNSNSINDKNRKKNEVNDSNNQTDVIAPSRLVQPYIFL